MARWTYDIGVTVMTTLSFDETTNSVWFVGDEGGLWSFRVLGQKATLHGAGWSSVIAVALAPDGLRILVAMSDGSIYWVKRSNANFSNSTLLVDLGVTIVAASMMPDKRLAVLTSNQQLSAIDSVTGEISPLVEGLTDAISFAIDDIVNEAIISFEGDAPRISRFDLSTGDEIGKSIELAQSVTAITTHPGGTGVIVSEAPGEIGAKLWVGTDNFMTIIPGISALTRWHSIIFVAHDTQIELLEWGDDVSILPIQSNPDPLALSGWGTFIVDYSAVNLKVGDIEWRVVESPYAGTLSLARPTEQQQDRYEHRVLSGCGPAEFTIEAIERRSGSLLATRRFRTVAYWPDNEQGPPLAITGSHQVYAKWGGGSAGPENIRVHPAPEVIRMAVVLLRTKGSTSAVDGISRAQQFHNYVTGAGLSVKSYYEEVSGRLTPASGNPADPQGSTVTLLGNRVFGPVDLPYSWGELFEPGNQADPWGSWNPKPGTWDLFGGTISSFLVDLSINEPGIDELVSRNADSIIFAVLPGTDDPYKIGDQSWSAQWSWASASDTQTYSKTDFSTSFIRRPAIIMPAAFPANHPSPWLTKEWVSTICHELGHNLGCPDLYDNGAYPAEIQSRMVDSWDLMATDSLLPHFSLAHKMRLGWINPAWIQVCDFAKDPSSRTLTLQAIETIPRIGPAIGQYAGVEIRIRPGWNYYFEYRRKQSMQIGDQALPVVQAVFGTDLHAAAAEEMARPLILQLPIDVDGDGPVLRRGGEDYEESDVTNPDRMNDFRLTRLPGSFLGFGDPNIVKLQIDYVGAHRAELQITPAPGRGNFKSPDIDIDGPAGLNVIVKGMTNIIRFRIRNAGTKDADQVSVKVQWLPFTTSAGSWNLLPGPSRQGIPAKQTREFTLEWPIPSSVQIDGKEVEHFCVRVDIDRYVDPLDSSGNEIVVNNNWAQSNFNTSAVSHGSPSERRRTPVLIHNSLPSTALHHTVIEQTGEFFRAYVDQSWRILKPNETATHSLEYESLAGDPVFGLDFDHAFRSRRGENIFTDLSTRGFLHANHKIDGPIERFGLELMVRAGLRTFIREAVARGEGVIGRVEAGWPENPQVVTGGKVRVVGWLVERRNEQFWRESPLHSDGRFTALFPKQLFSLLEIGRVQVAVYYLGTAFYTPCHSDDLDVYRE